MEDYVTVINFSYSLSGKGECRKARAVVINYSYFHNLKRIVVGNTTEGVMKLFTMEMQ